MSFTRDDDDMLDHPKWRRALRLGGDGALLVWWRLRAWCARRLTDGVVPADMVDEIAEIGRSKSRARALQALVESELCARSVHGEITICGYLERNPSRASVEAERRRRASKEQSRRDTRRVTGHATGAPDERAHVPIPIPIPIPIPEREEARSLGSDIEPEQTDPATHIRIPGTWKVTEEFFAEAFAAGVTRSGLEEAVTYWRGRKLGGEWFSIEEFFRGKFASIRQREEKARFAAHLERKGPANETAELDTTSAATVFHPTNEHRAFCADRRFEISDAVRAYRASAKARALGTVQQNADFMNRLKCWAAMGTFIAEGPLPRPNRADRPPLKALRPVAGESPKEALR